MRNIERIFLILLTAFVFALTPLVAMADNTSTGTELDHSDYGMDGWIDSFDTDPNTPGVQVEGDGAYGYYTGINPGFNGIGNGLWQANQTNWVTSGPYGAPSYTTPCPDLIDPQGDVYGDADCPANTDSSNPQTAPTATGLNALSDWNEWEIPILDDVLAKMWDVTAPNDSLAQTLDILFYLDPARKSTPVAGEENAFIDQTLDQDLADYQGNINSFVGTNGVGIVNRLVQIFGLSNSVTKADAPNMSDNLGDDVDFIDQWVLSYTKDIVGTPGTKIGIVSNYSGWFSLDKNVEPTCPASACNHSYATGHDTVQKDVPEVDGHPNDDPVDP